MVWCGLVWRGEMWCGVVLCCEEWYGVAWCGRGVLYSMVSGMWCMMRVVVCLCGPWKWICLLAGMWVGS